METKPPWSETLPCPYCGEDPVFSLGDPGAPYPGGYFTIECENQECPVSVCLSEKRKTDLPGMTSEEAEAKIWKEVSEKWSAPMKRIAELEEALAFYADPRTYHGCMFLFDRPTGGFDEDCSEDYDDEDYEGPMPGKLAREVLTRVKSLKDSQK